MSDDMIKLLKRIEQDNSEAESVLYELLADRKQVRENISLLIAHTNKMVNCEKVKGCNNEKKVLKLIWLFVKLLQSSL